MKIELAAGETITGCPMCGEYASLHATPIGAIQMKAGAQVMPQDSLYWCKCDDDECGVTMPAVKGRENAILRWNRRAA